MARTQANVAVKAIHDHSAERSRGPSSSKYAVRTSTGPGAAVGVDAAPRPMVGRTLTRPRYIELARNQPIPGRTSATPSHHSTSTPEWRHCLVRAGPRSEPTQQATRCADDALTVVDDTKLKLRVGAGDPPCQHRDGGAWAQRNDC